MTWVAVALGGLGLGLGGGVHCVALCGPMMIQAARPHHGDRSGRMKTLARLNAGRLASYTLAGAAVGLAGWSLYQHLDLHVPNGAIRLIAAVAIAWNGLVLLGIAPAIALPPAWPRGSSRASWIIGLGWGAMPCAMVYNALLMALLSGSPIGGAMTMLGFGFGTLPMLGGIALAIIGAERPLAHVLSPPGSMGTAPMVQARAPGGRALRRALGLSLMVVAAASAASGGAQTGKLCLH